jgi:hypothetical protein
MQALEPPAIHHINGVFATDIMGFRALKSGISKDVLKSTPDAADVPVLSVVWRIFWLK